MNELEPHLKYHNRLLQYATNASSQVAFFIMIIFVAVVFLVLVATEKKEKSYVSQGARAGEAAEVSPPVHNPFDEIFIQGNAAYVLDISSGRALFVKNEEQQLPLASLTKLMTALVASEHLAQDAVVIIKDSDLQVEGDSGLLLGESWYFKDLLDFTLIKSSNDGARAVARTSIEMPSSPSASPQERGAFEETFIERMNQVAARIGMSQTYFVNETGLDPTVTFSGSYGSAKDVALLLEYILHHYSTILEATTFETLDFTSLDGFVHVAENTNETIGVIPGLIGSKTGFTDLAGGNLAILFDAGIQHPLALIVLGSTEKGRFADMRALVAATLKSLEQ